MPATAHTAPPVTAALQRAGITVFERGWLSSNNILIQSGDQHALIDSGYCTHADQTLALVRHALGLQPLHSLLNTHLHSDHCGGNAALQHAYPQLRTHIPPGESQAVAQWDTAALSYDRTGQTCPRFRWDEHLTPGQSVQLGQQRWEIHAAQGHDPHSVILFLPSEGLLVSADALWQNGFGVVFPELDGHAAFKEVADTLDLIEALAPQTIIPGHGPVFQDVNEAIERARKRLAQFQQSPYRHQRHALKVLVKFKLLEWQRIERPALLAWAQSTAYLRAHIPTDPPQSEAWLNELLQELARSHALRLEGDWVLNQ